MIKMHNQELTERYRKIVLSKIEMMQCDKCSHKVSLRKDLRRIKCTRKSCRKVTRLTRSPLLYVSKLDMPTNLFITNAILEGSRNRDIKAFVKVNDKTLRRI